MLAHFRGVYGTSLRTEDKRWFVKLSCGEELIWEVSGLVRELSGSDWGDMKATKCAGQRRGNLPDTLLNLVAAFLGFKEYVTSLTLAVKYTDRVSRSTLPSLGRSMVTYSILLDASRRLPNFSVRELLTDLVDVNVREHECMRSTMLGDAVAGYIYFGSQAWGANVRALLEAKADPNARLGGGTSVLWELVESAGDAENIEILGENGRLIERLVSAKADVNERNAEGDEPLVGLLRGQAITREKLEVLRLPLQSLSEARGKGVREIVMSSTLPSRNEVCQLW